MEDRICVLGTGLIGASLGLRLAATSPQASVVGWDIDQEQARIALDRGAVTEIAESPQAAVRDAGVVVVAVPVDGMPPLFASLAPHIPSEAVVTDVGSTKTAVVAAGESALGARFVGGHPMAGSERHGAAAADPELFEDAWWILTPTEATSSGAYRRVAAVVTSLGAKPIAVAPQVHDDLLARLSHLPQLAASAVVDVARSQIDQGSLLGLAAGGFRDVTRIAASDPDLWVAIIRSNVQAVLDALEGMEQRLGDLRRDIAGGSWDSVHTFLDQARRARLELFAKSVYTGDPVALTLLIPDRPGVLAEVTTAAGELGANIEDIQIFHSTEGGRGRLELVVAGAEAAQGLLERLTELGYHVEYGLPE